MSCRFCGTAERTVRVVAYEPIVTYACGTEFFPTEQELGEPLNSCWSQSRECKAKATATNPSEMQARLDALEAEAKQAREDEAWARQNGACVSLSNEGCWAWMWDGQDERSISARTPTASAAIRALRAKMEGGSE